MNQWDSWKRQWLHTGGIVRIIIISFIVLSSFQVAFRDVCTLQCSFTLFTAEKNFLNV